MLVGAEQVSCQYSGRRQCHSDGPSGDRGEGAESPMYSIEHSSVPAVAGALVLCALWSWPQRSRPGQGREPAATPNPARHPGWPPPGCRGRPHRGTSQWGSGRAVGSRPCANVPCCSRSPRSPAAQSRDGGVAAHTTDTSCSPLRHGGDDAGPVSSGPARYGCADISTCTMLTSMFIIDMSGV